MKEPDGVELWHIDLSDPVTGDERWAAVLDAREQARAARFTFASGRRRYVAAHAATRAILGHYLAAEPAALRFAIGPSGKPSLVVSRGAVPQFNLSHSGDRAVLAVSAQRPVGVDIESVRADRADPGIARRFAPADVATLERVGQSQRAAAFTTMWTRKEALAKAFGGSVAAVLHVRVGDAAATDEGAVVRAPGIPDGDHRVLDLPTTGDFRVAVATGGAGAFVINSRDFDFTDPRGTREW